MKNWCWIVTLLAGCALSDQAPTSAREAPPAEESELVTETATKATVADPQGVSTGSGSTVVLAAPVVAPASPPPPPMIAKPKPMAIPEPMAEQKPSRGPMAAADGDMLLDDAELKEEGEALADPAVVNLPVADERFRSRDGLLDLDGDGVGDDDGEVDAKSELEAARPRRSKKRANKDRGRRLEAAAAEAPDAPVEVDEVEEDANAYGFMAPADGPEVKKAEEAQAQKQDNVDDLLGALDGNIKAKSKAAKKKPAVDADLRQSGEKRLGKKVRPEFGGIISGKDRKDEPPPEDPLRWVAPARFMPRVAYIENTYLGGNAAHEENLRRLDAAWPGGAGPYRRAQLETQAFDAPVDAGMALTATLDQTWVDKPGRVVLQVGLQGSHRFGWRRPPLDVMLVLDGPALYADPQVAGRTIEALRRRLGPRDRLGVAVAGAQGRQVLPPTPIDEFRAALSVHGGALRIDGITQGSLAEALTVAGAALRVAASQEARVPGTQIVLVLTAGKDAARIRAAQEAAHALSVQGAVTSIIDVATTAGAWWAVANAGHGNYNRARPGAQRGAAESVEAALDAELESLSRVIARLLRVNIRLAPHVEAIRVIGSRVLDEAEVRQVKAREEATDRNLSKTMGVKADRGADDDGIQSVIPYFYGGDSHVVLIELWVTKPGPVAEITLKYKDMVALTNATARVSASLGAIPKDRTPAELVVAHNSAGFGLAETLGRAANFAQRDQVEQARGLLRGARGQANYEDRALIDAFLGDAGRTAPGVFAQALDVARQRRIGYSAPTR